MPTFKVEFQVTPTHQYRDVDADDRDRAIAKVVEDESANGEVSVTRCVELPSEVNPTDKQTHAAHAKKEEQARKEEQAHAKR